MPRSNPNTSYTEGDVILSAHSKQYAAPTNKIEDGTTFWAADTASGTDNYVVTMDPAVLSYTTGLFLHFMPNTNNTGVATINLNGVGSNIIKKGDGAVDLADNDLVAGNIYLLVYNGTNFVLVSGGSGSSTSSDSITFQAINGEAFSIKAGQPVKLHSGGNPPTVKLAQADSAANSAFGIAAALAGTGTTFDVIKIGALNVADWTDVTGATNLTFNSEYFLGQGAAGVLDDNPPTGAGDIIQSIGKAISTSILYIYLLDYYQL